MAKGKRPITIALEYALTIRNSNNPAEREKALSALIELLDPMLDGRSGKFEPHVRHPKRPVKKRTR